MESNSRFVGYEKLKSFGIFLIGVSAVLMSFTLLQLLNQNSKLDSRLECRAQKRDELDAAIGRGLVAVAADDSDRLREQADLIIEVSDSLGEC